MKKYNLLLVLGVTLAVYFVLSWLIPTSTYADGEFQAGTLAPVSLFLLFKVPFQLFSTLAIVGNGIYLLVLGGFYGVLKATGVYDKLVNDFARLWNINKKLFISITIVWFSLLSTLTNQSLLLFMLVPLFTSVMMKMKISKVNALLATIGAIMIGNFASIYGMNGYLFKFLNMENNAYLIAKIIIYFLANALLILYMLFINDKKNVQSEITDEKIESNVEEKKSYLPLVLIFGFMFIFLLFASYDWFNIFGIDLFEKWYTAVEEYKLFGANVFQYLISGTNIFGAWGINNGDVTMTLMIVALLITWIYGIKFSKAFEAFIDGMKKMALPALYVVFANVILYLISIGQDSNLVNTIGHYILGLTKEFNILTAGLYTLLASLFYNDLIFFNYYNISNLVAVADNTNLHHVILFMVQMIHAVVYFVLPTGILLIAGLSYLEVSYIDWIKNVWKFVLLLFALAIVVIAVLLLL